MVRVNLCFLKDILENRDKKTQTLQKNKNPYNYKLQGFLNYIK